MRWPVCSSAHGDWLFGMVIHVRGTPNAERRIFASINDLNLDVHQAQIGQLCSVLPGNSCYTLAAGTRAGADGRLDG
jgi:hypothetical protein